MTRKAKIGSVMACIGFAIAAICFWPREDEGELQVSYVGTPASNSNGVVFALTNTSRRSVHYFGVISAENSAGLMLPISGFGSTNQTLAGWSQTNLDFIPSATNRWTFLVAYGRDFTEPFARGARNQVADFAADRGWERLAQFIYPRSKARFAFGPEMVGNKPSAGAGK